MSESPYLRRLMLVLTELGTRVFRNNVGQLHDDEGRVIRYGVCNPGGSDLIGWHSVEITPDMVGKQIAVFVAAEAKAVLGRASDPQLNFLAEVRKAGGIAIYAREPAVFEQASQAGLKLALRRLLDTHAH